MKPEAAREGLRLYFEWAEPRRESEVDPLFFYRLAEQRVVRARLEGGDFREALRDFRKALELGYIAHPWEVWDFFWLALEAGDRETATLIASLPDERWAKPAERRVPWLVLLVKSAFSVFFGGKPLEDARICLFEETLPEGIQPELEGLRAVYRKLEVGQLDFHSDRRIP